MSRVAYFDCFSGCSGDMILGALLDAGLSLDALRDGLGSLDLSGYHLSVEKVKRSTLNSTKFNVILDKSMPQPRRSLADILKTIDSSRLPEKVKKAGQDIFQRLGEVEAKIHGVALNEIHFHEIGAVDSIIDIMGTLLACDILKIEHFYSSPLPVGTGQISTAHGVLPVPAPATLQLLALVGAPIVDSASSGAPPGELLTPTGAVLVTSLASFRRPDMNIEKVGYGAGNKIFDDWPNVLRIWLGEEKEIHNDGDLILLETNIDDMNPQIYGFLMEKLFAEKAADVWFTPIQMKKNRPAIMLSVLAPASAEPKLTEIILRETSTLGMRVRTVSRHTAQREMIEFDSSLGRVRAKVKRLSGKVLSISPEYDDCRRIALDQGLPFQVVYRIVESETYQHLKL